MPKKYLTQAQVASVMGIKVSTLQHNRCIKSKGWENMPFLKVGGVILYPEDEFYLWLDSFIQNKSA